MHGFYTDVRLNLAIKKNRNAAAEKLRRLGVEQPGKHVNYLFDTFINCQGRILARHVQKQGLPLSQKFSLWRDHMKDLGVIDFRLINNRTMVYMAGHEIIHYINKEKNLTKEIATTEDLIGLEERLVDMIINTIDPYSNEEKRQKFARGDYQNKFEIIRKV